MANERRIEYTTIKLELDVKTGYADHKKNRYSGYIKSIRVGRASSPNAIFKIRLKEGDEIQLWPGRIINFAERSEGAVFSWDSLPSEWAEIEISENSYFVAGETRSASSGGLSVASTFRKSDYALTDAIVTKILSINELRVKAIIYNYSVSPIFVGNEAEIDPGISMGLRAKKAIKIMPFQKREIEITGELFAIRHPGYTHAGFGCPIFVEEFLK